MTEECWIWAWALNTHGYAGIKSQDVYYPVHRLMYELEVGKIPKGLQLDHLCRNRACINPAHLEPVTAQENVRRGIAPPAQNAKKTHCHKGHEFDKIYTNANTGEVERRCTICRNQWAKDNWQKKKLERLA